ALGHLWYADKALGDFVAKAENKYSNALFAFTGDHYGRKFINGSPTLYERSSVPFILYGKSVAENSKRVFTPGSHIDITPTLIELVAPPNHTYYSFGNSLLKKNTENGIGIGYNKVIDTIKLLEFSKNYGIKKQSINSHKLTDKKNKKNKEKHDNLMSLAWYYTTRGDSIN
ncbi:MAG: sulfatase-like hydrolase/transferase, partial [Polaribacter sp.]|nr:sulfatase-like hydrolase/transferase [Polaribacter sp.]